MRFNSKSLLSTMQISHLQFTCENIAAWAAANPGKIYIMGDFLPVETLGFGNYGACFRLRDYPGLVLKLCGDENDGYPAYIRAVAMCSKPKAWMPKVFMHGGKVNSFPSPCSFFWCVLPEYDNPWGHDAHHWDSWIGRTWPLTACATDNSVRDDQLALRKMTKRERRMTRQVREFLSPMAEQGARVYMHAKNALLDGEQWIITDPIASWYRGGRHADF